MGRYRRSVVLAETINISEIAGEISKNIFQKFLWNIHPQKDENFDCVNKEHNKKTHPTDVVFHYDDPYLGCRIYLNTDLKSYGSNSIAPTKLRSAFKSMCLSVECARESDLWKQRYLVDDTEAYEIRGFVFIHNHDAGYEKNFYDELQKVNLRDLPLPTNVQIHYLGPSDIQRLFTIANDIKVLIADEELPRDYTFYYPDLVLTRRQSDIWNQAATVETLVGPYCILKHKGFEGDSSGYVIYYNSPANTTEEFEYFLDCLSRFQLLSSDEKIKIRVTSTDAPNDLKAIFHRAIQKYVKAWGFDPAREKILESVEIERVAAVANNYNPGDLGWRT